MGIRLREITQQALGLKINILAKESQMVAMAQQTFKKFQSLLFLPYFKEAVDEPKGTNGKGR
jgi:hypothetical protein